MRNKLVVILMFVITVTVLVSGCSNEKVTVKEDFKEKVKEEVIIDLPKKEGSSLDSIKTEISAIKLPNEFTMRIEGLSTGEDFEYDLQYDVYYKNLDVRIDTYWYNKLISTAIYNEKDDATYIHTMQYTNFAEYTKGNLLPIRLIDIEFLEKLETYTEDEFFTANYETLNGEKVLYIKSSINNGVTTEMWYSLEYLVPVKFHETFVSEDGIEEVNWHVAKVDKTKPVNDNMFDIPDDAVISENSADDYFGNSDLEVPIDADTESQINTTREALLYKVDYIDTEEISIVDMTQIFYYSNESYENLVSYFKNLLKDTEEYSIIEEEKKTMIDGTLNEKPVVVIINNYMKYEPEVKKNGVNVNYY